jgi:hypothetical protein
MSDPIAVSRRLVAVFAADVVGYSRLMGVDEVATLQALKAHRRTQEQDIQPTRPPTKSNARTPQLSAEQQRAVYSEVLKGRFGEEPLADGQFNYLLPSA